MPVILFIYSILLFLLCLIAWPAWLLKMRRRGGWGSGLIQRIGAYRGVPLERYQNCDYYHAVSVGEAVMALKVIAELTRQNADYRAVVACTTATGHQIARSRTDLNTLVIYAPIDLPFLIHALFKRLTPRQLILIDSELWPNLLSYTKRKNIPLKIINGRISDKSFQSLSRWQPVIKPLLCHTTSVCTDGKVQCSRWEHLGVPAANIHDVGSLKFDFQTDALSPPPEFKEQLDAFPPHQFKILLASTHKPEELELARELKKLPHPLLLMVAPRHAERRQEVTQALESLGFHVTLRSQFSPPDAAKKDHAFLLDTTGELQRWTNLADLVLIGKSWLKATGGQNPFEAIAQGKPLIAGPHMGNFEPLFSETVRQNGALQLRSTDAITTTLTPLLDNPDQLSELALNGKNYLATKLGATEKTARLLIKP